MEKAKNQKSSGSVIAGDMVITGDVTFQGQLHIEGAIKGSLRGDRAGLGRSARLEGEIILQELDCHGKMQGEVATGRLLVRNTAEISGTIEAGELDLAHGAVVSGDMKISSDFEGVHPHGGDTSREPQMVDEKISGTENKPTQTAGDGAEDYDMPEELSILQGLSGTIEGGSQVIMVVSDRSDYRRRLCHDLKDRLKDVFAAVLIDDPSGSVRDVLYRITTSIGIDVRNQNDQAQILADLDLFCNASVSVHTPVILLIENGETMYPATLEGIIQHLTSKGATESALMQIVLFGGTDLKKMIDLESPEFLAREPDCIFEI